MFGADASGYVTVMADMYSIGDWAIDRLPHQSRDANHAEPSVFPSALRWVEADNAIATTQSTCPQPAPIGLGRFLDALPHSNFSGFGTDESGRPLAGSVSDLTRLRAIDAVSTANGAGGDREVCTAVLAGSINHYGSVSQTSTY